MPEEGWVSEDGDFTFKTSYERLLELNKPENMDVLMTGQEKTDYLVWLASGQPKPEGGQS